MKQVAHIRQISLALRKRFGEQRRIDDQLVYTFASPLRLAQASEKELRDCELGYRAKNLRATARLVSSGQADLEGGRRCLIPSSENNCARCQAWGRRLRIA